VSWPIPLADNAITKALSILILLVVFLSLLPSLTTTVRNSPFDFDFILSWLSGSKWLLRIRYPPLRPLGPPSSSVRVEPRRFLRPHPLHRQPSPMVSIEYGAAAVTTIKNSYSSVQNDSCAGIVVFYDLRTMEIFKSERSAGETRTRTGRRRPSILLQAVLMFCILRRFCLPARWYGIYLNRPCRDLNTSELLIPSPLALLSSPLQVARYRATLRFAEVGYMFVPRFHRLTTVIRYWLDWIDCT
jgi:hypothetical protein